MSEQKEINPSEAAEQAEETMSTLEDSPTEHVHDDHDAHGAVLDFEPESVNSTLILGIVLSTVLVVLVLIVVGFTITGVYSTKMNEQLVTETSYPEIRDVRAAATAELNESGMVDAEAGIYRIPVERAMDLMVEQNYLEPGENLYQGLKITPTP